MAAFIRRFDPSFSSLDWDPIRVMRDVLRWEPGSAAAAAGRAQTASFVPPVDVKETQTAFVIHADLPGIAEKDLNLSLTGNQLTLSGKREWENKKDEGSYHTYERSYGSFSRTFTLPDSVDAEHIEAEMKDGVLTLTIPKRPEVKARKIELKSPTQNKA